VSNVHDGWKVGTDGEPEDRVARLEGQTRCRLVGGAIDTAAVVRAVVDDRGVPQRQSAAGGEHTSAKALAGDALDRRRAADRLVPIEGAVRQAHRSGAIEDSAAQAG